MLANGPAFNRYPSIFPFPRRRHTYYTANDGNILGGTFASRRWLLDGVSVGTGSTLILSNLTTGNLVLEVTASGTGGPITVTSEPLAINPFLIINDGAPIVPTINVLVVSGDSLTVPTSYADTWAAENPSKTVNIRAEVGRSLGAPANLDDGSNTVWGHRTEDLAFNPQLYTLFMGQNGPLQSGYSPASYWTDYKGFVSTVRVSGRKIGIATLTKRDSRNATYTTFNSAATTFNATMRTNFADIADFVIPFGEIPELNPADGGAASNPFLTDGIHWQPATKTLALEVFRAAVNPVIAGSTETAPTAGAWFGPGTTNAAINTTLTFRYCITGAQPGLGMSVSLSAPSIAAGVKFQHGPNSNLTSSTGAINGDYIILSVPTSGSYSTATPCTITIGTRTISLTVQTAASAPAVITYDPAQKYSGVSLSNLNRTMTNATAGAHAKARATAAYTGKRYSEWTIGAGSGSSFTVGVLDAAYPVTTQISAANHPGASGTYAASGATFVGSAIYANGSTIGATGITGLAAGDIVMMAVDETAGKVYFGKNGTWVTGHNPSAGTGGITFNTPLAQYYGFSSTTGTQTVTINNGQDAFAYTLPTGYLAGG